MENQIYMENKIIQFFQDNFMVDLDNEFSRTDSFLENGIIDSTGVLELVMFLEENFKINVNDDEIRPENLDSLENLVAYINRKKNL